MPLSDHRHRPWVLASLQEECPDLSKIRSVVDVGAGFGGWREFLQPFTPTAHWTAIEVWLPYTERFLYRYRYSATIVADICDVDPLPQADIYILGDVIEHMPFDEAIRLWKRVLAASWRTVLCLPIVHYPQGEAEGNPYEAHVETWLTERVYNALPEIIGGRVNEVTGAFIARGALEGP